ncbi:MAG: hypothetical protein U9Q81_09775 [Pseudomonadota bacterium]|nr:hypothetical protein [Pseudomonadota bacterium]
MRACADQAVAELRRIPELSGAERRKSVIAHIRATLQKPEVPVTPSPEDLVREDRER